ncbi:hypothetical protein MSKU15_1485 [Komagataeibacter diospyri]|nr:hypothetical protein MSKU15_1485 [Komagataeibacter diospyri]
MLPCMRYAGATTSLNLPHDMKTVYIEYRADPPSLASVPA